MNFNPMDLIKLKEAFCPDSNKDFPAITKFISWLIDIQANGLSEKMIEVLGEGFVQKQEMIQKAYDIKNIFEIIEKKGE